MKSNSNDGFTLIEVLIALVILSVGLLSLEALGIGAARANAVADRQSGHAVIGADSLESGLHQLRQQLLPSQFCQTNLQFGDRLSRQVDVSNPRLVVVTVRVFSNQDSPNPPPEDFIASSSVYLSTPISGTPVGQPCS